ncbi:hypothetical protein CARUB_v10021849mg [Capsella rubella]|uniref:Uncharacterized protein n=1 Tax=Capsella rubella TaxID=81985 RepID=R0HWT8_9BRAS|nr:hypothetical protein CARUB_v10021849mg [Capsella rubella]
MAIVLVARLIQTKTRRNTLKNDNGDYLRILSNSLRTKAWLRLEILQFRNNCFGDPKCRKKAAVEHAAEVFSNDEGGLLFNTLVVGSKLN